MTSPFGIPDLTDVFVVDEHPLVRRYQGRLSGHEQPVLLEVISDGAASSRSLLESHPGLLETLAVGETEAGESTVVWPRGETLAERLDDMGALAWHRATDLVATLADAVDHAHQRSMFHGAIDPSAVQFGGDRRPLLGGFGLAQLRLDGALAADPAFTAPEVGSSGTATRAGDIYSLGAVLVAAISGEATARRSTLADDAPEPIAAVVERAMAPDPDDRFESAAALAQSLRAARDTALYGDDDDDGSVDDLIDEVPAPAAVGEAHGEITYIGLGEAIDGRQTPIHGDTHGEVIYIDLAEETVVEERPAPIHGDTHGEVIYIDLAEETVVDGRQTPIHGDTHGEVIYIDLAEETVVEERPAPIHGEVAHLDLADESVVESDEPVDIDLREEPVDAVEHFVLPPLEDENWYSTDQNADWTELVNAMMADEVSGPAQSDDDVEPLAGPDDVDGRAVITLADAERGARETRLNSEDRQDLSALVSVDAAPAPGTEPGSAVTIVEVENVVGTMSPSAAPGVSPAPPVLTVETGRVEIDDAVEGDVLVVGGQLIIRAPIHGSVTVDGGRAVVFAPVSGDVTNSGGTVSVEAPVSGRIRGQREFTSVRPGSQNT